MRLRAQYLIGRRSDTFVAFRLEDLSEVGRLPESARGQAGRAGFRLQLHGRAMPIAELSEVAGPSFAATQPPSWFVSTRESPVIGIGLDTVSGIHSAVAAAAQTDAVQAADAHGFLCLDGHSVPLVSAATLRALAARSRDGLGG